MPTPLDLILDPVSLASFTIFGLLIAWEAIAPARRLPRAPWWHLRALASFAAFFLLSAYLPLFWGATLAHWQLFDLSHLGTLSGWAVGLLAYEACAYAWHRSLHGFTPMWRWLHQMHHSAERLDTFGAYWFSPLDMVGWTAVGSIALVVVVGLSPMATTAVSLTITLLAIFQHANVRTPRWLGWFVQRPESHSLHHQRGEHRRNYADLPVFDMLFGTYENPRRYAPATGFHDGASLRVGEMLLGRDVSTPPAARPHAAQVATGQA